MMPMFDVDAGHRCEAISWDMRSMFLKYIPYPNLSPLLRCGKGNWCRLLVNAGSLMHAIVLHSIALGWVMGTVADFQSSSQCCKCSEVCILISCSPLICTLSRDAREITGLALNCLAHVVNLMLKDTALLSVVCKNLIKQKSWKASLEVCL